MGGKQILPGDIDKLVDIGSGSETASMRTETPMFDRKGKLERGHSSEKENIQQGPSRPPLQRTTSQGREQLRRQYSYGDPRSSDSHRAASDSGRVLPNPNEARRRCSVSDLSDVTLRDERTYRESNRYHDPARDSPSDRSTRTRDSTGEFDRLRNADNRHYHEDRCYRESSLERHRGHDDDRRLRTDRGDYDRRDRHYNNDRNLNCEHVPDRHRTVLGSAEQRIRDDTMAGRGIDVRRNHLDPSSAGELPFL